MTGFRPQAYRRFGYTLTTEKEASLQAEDKHFGDRHVSMDSISLKELSSRVGNPRSIIWLTVTNVLNTERVQTPG
jgi:hypothetical protein